MATNNNKFLAFGLSGENYAIPILKVKEIIGMVDITKIPRVPNFIKGVINLRGKIVPVIDLRLKFGFKERKYNDRTSIIILEILTDSTSTVSSIVVDSVNEVLDIEPCEIEPPSLYGSDVEKAYSIGIGKVNDSIVILLDVVKLLSFD